MRCGPMPPPPPKRSSAGCSRSRRSPTPCCTMPCSPARGAVTAPFPAWLDPRIVRGLEGRGIASLYSHQAEAIEAVHARRGHRRRHPDRVGQDAVLRAARAPGAGRRSVGAGPLPVPDQGPRPGPGRRVRRAGAGQRAARRRRPPTTATRRRRSARPSGVPARSSSPTRTCSTRRSCRTTRSGSSSSSRSRSSSSTSCTSTAACSAATSRTSFGGCSGCAATTARTRSSCAPRPRSGIRPSWRRSSRAGRRGSSIATARPRGERHVLLVDPPLLDQATGARGSALTHAQRWALPFLRAGRQTIVFGRARDRGRDHPDRPARVPAGAASARAPGSGATAVATCRPSAGRSSAGLRDGEILGVVSTNALELGVDIGAPRRLDPGRLSGLGRRHLAAARAGWPAAGDERRHPRRVGLAGRPVRDPPPRVPPRGHARGGAPRPGQPPRPARPPPLRHVRAAVRAGRGLRARARRRPARVHRRGGPRPPGRRRPLVLELRELPGLGGEPPGRGARERRDHRHDPGPAAGHRRGGPLLGAGPRPRARRSTSTTAIAVLRRPARLGRAQGLRPAGRRRLLHLREPGGDPEAPRRLRDRARAAVAGASTARSWSRAS